MNAKTQMIEQCQMRDFLKSNRLPNSKHIYIMQAQNIVFLATE